MEKQATMEILYHETLRSASARQDTRYDDPDLIEVSVKRWDAPRETVAILSRTAIVNWERTIDDETLIVTVDAKETAQLQRIGIRVFDELKAAHPTLSQE